MSYKCNSHRYLLIRQMIKISCVFLLCIDIFIGSTSCYAQNNQGRVRHMYKSIGFLNEISGKKTVAGIHNREPNDSPQRWTNEIYKLTGKYPGLWSGDFLFQSENISNRQVMISEALRQWNHGALVNIMWHACNPALTEPCGWDSTGVLSSLSDQEWRELTTDETVLNRAWKRRVDEICPFLESLRKNGVEVLWRPMHEM